MRLSARLPLLISLWFAAEVAAFALVAHAVGFGGALFLCFLTSLWGFAMLRRLGLATAWRLRRALASRSYEDAGLSREAMIEGALVGLGSVLLILPGFVSDFFGIALAAPSVRAWLGAKIGSRGGRGPLGRDRGPKLIDLDPQEWTHTEPPGAKPAKLRPAKSRS